MIKLPILVCCLICIYRIYAQDNNAAIKKAYELFEKDSQLKYAVSSLTIADVLTGRILFSKNSNSGLVPASTLKVLTAAAALEILKPSYRYTTTFYLASAAGISDVYVSGSGDPTLGSDRFSLTKEKSITDSLQSHLSKRNIKLINGGWYALNEPDINAIPSKWIWEDIGNYYGAVANTLNWKENQYTIWLTPGNNIGDPVEVKGFEPAMQLTVNNELISGSAQSGDLAYIFFNPGENGITIKGSVPCCRDRFSINGAVPSQGKYALQQLSLSLGGVIRDVKHDHQKLPMMTVLYQHKSPSLDSIVYWLLHKSINLYGEALIRTITKKDDVKNKNKEFAEILKQFWNAKGIDADALVVEDGSGLSPSNRVTSGAIVKALVYAKKQSWFPVYLHAFPLQHGFKIKSGTVGGVKAYAGYLTTRSGKQYCFSFIVNNYNGSTSSLTKKMFEVLNVLKN